MPCTRGFTTLYRLFYLAIMLLTSGVIGWVLESVHFKLGWMFGGVAGAALTSCFLLPALKLSGRLYINKMRQTGQAILGGGIGCLLHFSDIGALGWLFIDIVIMMVLSLISSFVLAILFSLLSTRQSVKTTFFSTLPGGIGIMANLAQQYGANAELVAIVQSVRILSVVMFTPFVLTNLMRVNLDAVPVAGGDYADYLQLINAALILAISALGYYLAHKMRIASPSLIGPLLLAILVGNLMPSHSVLILPPLLSHAAQILLGVTLGHGIIARLATLRLRDVAIGLLSIVFLLLFSLVIAAFFHMIAPVDWQTAILSTAPGGAAEMIILAKTLDTHMEIVVTAQVLRQIIVNSLVPVWVALSDHVEALLPKRTLPVEAEK